MTNRQTDKAYKRTDMQRKRTCRQSTTHRTKQRNDWTLGFNSPD